MTQQPRVKSRSGNAAPARRDLKVRIDERIRQLLDHSVAAAALLTPEGVIKFVNENALEISGLTKQDVLGRPLWEAIWWSYDPKAQATMRRAVQDAKAGRSSRFDIAAKSALDERIFLDFRVSPVRDPSGQVIELMASAVDVTERVTSQRRLEQLVHEMSHRIKNLLTTVSAMARMTQRTARPEGAFGEFAARLEALTAAHEALNDSNTAEAFFENLARRLLRPYKTLQGSRITISGPRVRLASSEAKMLALCLYELATNAIKYGALSNSEGRVSVVLSKPDEQGQITFTWTETDGPRVNPPTRQGYGTRFIISTLQSLFGSKVSLDYWPEGLRVSVSGPASALLAPCEQNTDGRGSSATAT